MTGLGGGLPDRCASLANHIGGNVVLLRTNTYSIVTSSFGEPQPQHLLLCGDRGKMFHLSSMGVEVLGGVAVGHR